MRIRDDWRSFYAGSGEIFTEVPDDLQVEMTLVYGKEVITSLADVSDEGEWFASMTLPMRAPFNPTMNVSTTVLNVPGLGTTSSNTGGKVTVEVDPLLYFRPNELS
ncbi:MAG: hypothetical protein Ct9H90mP23_2700 [Methanobacteriota archaeon]|nr:MAG: hypothetical protein Ct9H90mP23_2700 [Euryarchaeota archaeon]